MPFNKDKMKAVKSLWRKSREDLGQGQGANEIQKLPEGKYNCQIMNLTTNDTKEGKFLVTAKFKVLKGDHADVVILNSWDLLHEVGNSIFMKFLNVLGYFNDDIEDTLEEILEDIINNEFIVQVAAVPNKKNDKYTNYFVNEVVSAKELGDSPDPDTASEPIPTADDPVTTKKKVAKKKKVSSKDEPYFKELLEFASAVDLKVTKKTNYDEVFTLVKNCSFDRNQLEEDEIKMLNDLKLSECILEPVDS